MSYITVEQSLLDNAYRHYCNGMKYLEQGLTHHARGSFIKAQRNYDRASLIVLTGCIFIDFDRLARNLTERILNG